MNRSLQAIQNDFQEYVLGLGGDQPAIAADIATPHGLPAQRRLAIYHDAYRLRLHDALSEAYDKTHRYVGDDLFAELSNGYIAAQPSRYRNLRWYGDGFSEFVAQALPDYPAVAELAAFEWALGLAFDAADAHVLNAEDLRDLDDDAWQEIGFDLQPSVQFLSMQSNAAAIWLALEQEQTPPDATISTTATQWLVWRKNLQPHFRSLDPHEAQALQEIRRGECFSAVCENTAGNAQQEITVQIAGWLQNWLGDAVLASVLYMPDQMP